MRKKRVLFHSNHSKAFTGFGKNCRNILSFLYKTGEYEIIEACNGLPKSHPALSKLPWKCVGTLPDSPERLEELNKDPNVARAAGYGAEMIDELIKEFKPDIYIGAEDIWGFNGFWKKKWWDKISSMIWTTLDSEPLLPLAIEAAPCIKNYYVWASFAEREMKKLGHNHVKTLRGSLDISTFNKVEPKDRAALRSKYKIDSNCFLIGFVFRNQLRKSVPNMLDGYNEFKRRNPSVNTKLLFHTNWSEGWDIPRLLKEKNISPLDVLTTYFCPNCRQYEIKPFLGQAQDCPFCGSQKSQNTTNVSAGVSESQLNEVYNLMDVYCHPFTSGGQEIPVQEAKLTELITLVTNYSCGEDSCTPASGGLPLDWAEYREPGTQFIKASTYPSSIAKQLSKVYKMPLSKRESLGKKARQFVIDNFSIETVGRQVQEILASMPHSSWDFDFTEKPRNPKYMPPSDLNNSDWLIDIYKYMLNMDVDHEDDGHKYWMAELEKSTNPSETRQSILGYFQQVATKENTELDSPEELKKQFAATIADQGRPNLAVIIPQSAGDVLMVNSLISNLRSLYPKHTIWVITQPVFYPLIEDHPDVDCVLPMLPDYDRTYAHHFLQGSGDHEGFFDIAFQVHIGTQHFDTYSRGGVDLCSFDLTGDLLLTNVKSIT